MPNLLTRTAQALNPTKGDGPIDRIGPLTVLLAWVLLGFLLVFAIVPTNEFNLAFWGMLGLPTGLYIRHSAPA